MEIVRSTVILKVAGKYWHPTAHFGNPAFSEETRRLMSESAKVRWERYRNQRNPKLRLVNGVWEEVKRPKVDMKEFEF